MATKLFLYGIIIVSSAALSAAVTVPLAAAVLAVRRILPRRMPDTRSGP